MTLYIVVHWVYKVHQNFKQIACKGRIGLYSKKNRVHQILKIGNDQLTSYIKLILITINIFKNMKLIHLIIEYPEVFIK